MCSASRRLTQRGQRPASATLLMAPRGPSTSATSSTSTSISASTLAPSLPPPPLSSSTLHFSCTKCLLGAPHSPASVSLTSCKGGIEGQGEAVRTRCGWGCDLRVDEGERDGQGDGEGKSKGEGEGSEGHTLPSGPFSSQARM